MEDTRYLLDDMKKYNKSFKEENYVKMNKKDILKEFSEYYDKNLPVDLLTWSRANEPDKTMLYEQAFWNQVLFVRDNLTSIFYENFNERMANPVLVVNTHVSKSIKLPVYELNIAKYGLKITLVNNFYEWSVSINSTKELDMNFTNLFDTDKEINPIYCDGLSNEQVYSSFNNNKKQFTFKIVDDYRLFTIIYFIKDYLKQKLK